MRATRAPRAARAPSRARRSRPPAAASARVPPSAAAPAAPRGGRPASRPPPPSIAPSPRTHTHPAHAHPDPTRASLPAALAGLAFGAAYSAADLPGAIRRAAGATPNRPDAASSFAAAPGKSTSPPRDENEHLPRRIRPPREKNAAAEPPRERGSFGPHRSGSDPARRTPFADGVGSLLVPVKAEPSDWRLVDRASARATLLGHHRFLEAPRASLVPIDPGLEGGEPPPILLRRSAAEAFRAMRLAAANDGVAVFPISGFRSVARQDVVFRKGMATRRQTVAERAAVSAPPGYSEHHTGYAIDVGASPEDELTPAFERTSASRWLARNARDFGFENSFPADAPRVSGVAHEPWHFRFVGDAEAARTFAAAREAAEAARAARRGWGGRE